MTPYRGNSQEYDPTYNHELCKQLHRQIQRDHEAVVASLKKHEERIQRIERCEAHTEAELESLLDDIDELIGKIRWGGRALITAVIAIAVYMIQQSL